jgi:hypothetical protein
LAEALNGKFIRRRLTRKLSGLIQLQAPIK